MWYDSDISIWFLQLQTNITCQQIRNGYDLGAEENKEMIISKYVVTSKKFTFHNTRAENIT